MRESKSLRHSSTPLLDRLLVGGPPKLEPFPYDWEGTPQAPLCFCSACQVYGQMNTCWHCGSDNHLTDAVHLPYWLY